MLTIKVPRPALVAAARTIDYNGEKVKLGALQHKLLLTLHEAGPGRPVNRDALIKAIWGDPGVNANRLDQLLYDLRRKLPGLIGTGYKSYFLNASATSTVVEPQP